MKRLFDIVVAAIGVVVFAPLLLLIFVLQKACSKGPALFKQERIGKDRYDIGEDGCAGPEVAVDDRTFGYG